MSAGRRELDAMPAWHMAAVIVWPGFIGATCILIAELSMLPGASLPQGLRGLSLTFLMLWALSCLPAALAMLLLGSAYGVPRK